MKQSKDDLRQSWIEKLTDKPNKYNGCVLSVNDRKELLYLLDNNVPISKDDLCECGHRKYYHWKKDNLCAGGKIGECKCQEFRKSHSQDKDATLIINIKGINHARECECNECKSHSQDKDVEIRK